MTDLHDRFASLEAPMVQNPTPEHQVQQTSSAWDFAPLGAHPAPPATPASSWQLDSVPQQAQPTPAQAAPTIAAPVHIPAIPAQPTPQAPQQALAVPAMAPATPVPVAAMPAQPMAPMPGMAMPYQLQFRFDGGAASYLGVGIVSVLLTVFTLGLALPWAVCMQHAWRTRHTLINGQRVEFTGSGASLFGHWIKWYLLCLVTLGIYGFWVQPRLTRWIVEHQRATVPMPVQAAQPVRHA